MRDLELLLDTAQKSNDCVLLEAVHGVGKSERLEAFGHNQNAEVVVLHLATQEVGDLTGIPTIVGEGENAKTIWSKPSWLVRLENASKEGRESVLLLDELNRAATDVLAASLSLVLDKKIHEHALPVGKYETFVCAAINPTEDYHTNDMDPALLDRFIGPVELKADAEEWMEWARTKNINPVLIKFIAKNPKYIHYTPKDGSKGTSPRAWTKVSKLLENIDKDSSILYTLLKGRLGQAIGAEFMNFYRNHSDMVSITDITAIIKKHSKKENSYKENLNNTQPYINKILKDQEVPVVNNLIEEVYSLCKNKENYLVLNHLCYGVNLEIATAFVKNLKAKDISNFNKWATDNGSQSVFARIVQKINI